MAPPALEVQDICDYICDFLHDSPTALRVCALVSSALVSSAQRHLFHEIDLTRTTAPTTSTVDHGSAASSLIAASSRLHTILAESPHLARFIRHLRIDLEPDVLAYLTQVPLANLESIVLRAPTPRTRPLPNTVFDLAAPLVALPSVQKIKLVSVVFEGIESLHALFHQRSRISSFNLISLENIEIPAWVPTGRITEGHETLPQIMVEALELSSGAQLREPGWLIDHVCPLNFSALVEINIWCRTSPSVLALMRSARSSLHTLRIDARDATHAFRLADFLALRKLDVFGGFGGAKPATALLASAGTAELRLAEISIRIAVLGTLDNESLRRLDTTIAGLKCAQLRSVHVSVSRTAVSWSGMPSAEFVARMQELRGLFSLLNARGYLGLSYIDDDIRSDV
ncbi:hypothetical protein C8R45DRAFT_87642 [Mycena sanguinolenta]|nr:hypothetical protein C8R45DRAFT_87642 [Mycena sanguinolenta]